MTKKCKYCDTEVSGKEQICSTCRKDRADIYYAHTELRFEMWNFLKHHGSKAMDIFNAMVDEEGELWARKALGDELVDELQRAANS